MLRDKLQLKFKSLIGTNIVIQLKSEYVNCTHKFKLARVLYSTGGHASKVDGNLVPDSDISLHDEENNMVFSIEYEKAERMVEDYKTKCELIINYENGIEIRIYKQSNFSF